MNSFKEFRPPVFTGKGDRFLPQIVDELTEILVEMEDSINEVEFPLGEESWEIISGILVEFAEDMHNDIGIWESYERYNLDFFGIPLPLTLDPAEEIEPGTIDKERIFHLLWILLHEMFPDYTFSPQHYGIWNIAEVATDFLVERFEDVPQSSGVKQFLIQPNDNGWDVIKKLIWLGMNSYMFRLLYAHYIIENDNESDEEEDDEIFMDLPDDFICEETTVWSGLGAIDILAGILDITPEQRNELRGWYGRRFGFFKVLSVNGGFLKMINIFNDEPYTVRAGKKEIHDFKPGCTVLGYLVPWKNEWYWLGKQTLLGKLPKEAIEEIKKDIIIKFPHIVNIYDKEKSKMEQEELKKHHDKFVNYYGDDFKFFPDGKTMAAEEQKFYRKELNDPCREISYPPILLDCENGIGVYYNPDEGQEIMSNFNDVLNGFKKKGVNLNDDEKDYILEFIKSEDLSPKFAEKFAEKYGYESVLSSFLIPDKNNKTYFEYLLRRYKGLYYRNKYPSMGLV